MFCNSAWASVTCRKRPRHTLSSYSITTSILVWLTSTVTADCQMIFWKSTNPRSMSSDSFTTHHRCTVYRGIIAITWLVCFPLWGCSRFRRLAPWVTRSYLNGCPSFSHPTSELLGPLEKNVCLSRVVNMIEDDQRGGGKGHLHHWFIYVREVLSLDCTLYRI